MIEFIKMNKKGLTILWTVVPILFSAMIFAAMPFFEGPPPNTEEKFMVLFVTVIGLPLLFSFIMFIKSWMYSYKLNKNMQYQPFADFFKQNGFVVTWVDVDSYWTIAEKALVGSLLNKKILCRIDQKHMDRLDFIIYGLNPDKTKANVSFMRNLFDLEEPRFYDDTIYKSFNRTKKLTTEIISAEIESLIRKYE